MARNRYSDEDVLRLLREIELSLAEMNARHEPVLWQSAKARDEAIGATSPKHLE